ncbi:MAG: Uma2 family endonuclease [Thermomicrobium sp.]|uniref:Uma2 family endonuclease n=1 Tax=Thermomicrobium sp. TaxID=1969469 RepID=UPI001B108527|nr:Uma2 family endonuclease [Thermomicrobium sp.]MBO9352253.1 Uma2 family endonuclease [Thermomicrobium sp.]MBO9352254.1 Uma2 family endonuclease [Thermomicrobium sp.]
MQQTAPPVPTRHRFTVDDLERMVRSGILLEDARVELIEGELYDMNPIGWAHQACVNWLTERFATALAGRAIVQPQGPIRLNAQTLPQPDLALLHPRPDYYRHTGPTPADVFLLVEVSDTTLVYDRDVKLPLYARADIPEVWLIDLPGQRVLVFREPVGDRYRATLTFRPGDRISPQAFPDISLAVDDLLGT